MSTAPAPTFTRGGTRRALVALELFLALNAVGGAVYAFGGAEGIDRRWLDGTPFHDYVVPGVVLLVAVGGSLAIAAIRLLRHPSAWQLSLVAGTILIGWLATETLIIGLVSWMQPATLALALVIVWLSLRLSPTTASTVVRHPSRIAYGALAAALLTTILALLVDSNAEWWPAVAFALGPDLAVLYGIAPGLAHGQLHPRAVPLHNALHRFWGPLTLLVVATSAGLPVGWVAGALAWAFHVAFDRAIGLRLRSPDGFQRGDSRQRASCSPGHEVQLR
jgi:hypothetical protein